MDKNLSTSQTTKTGDTLTRGHKKKARTRRQLLEAALRIYARKGTGELALNELADEAGVSNGTIYNYFRTRQEVLEAVGMTLADQLSRHVAAISVDVEQGAQRLAIGVRTFVLQALNDRQWAAAIICVVRYEESMRSTLGAYVRDDLRWGFKQGDFKYTNEEIAMNFVVSATMGAILAIVEGQHAERYDAIVAEMILLALGVSTQDAKEIANRPLPEAG